MEEYTFMKQNMEQNTEQSYEEQPLFQTKDSSGNNSACGYEGAGERVNQGVSAALPQKKSFFRRSLPFLGGLALGIFITTVASLVIFVTRTHASKENMIRACIETYFLNEVDEQALEDGKYKGMVAALDDEYSTYYTKEEMTEKMQHTSGVYKGIGAVLSQDLETGAVTVVRCYEGSPAEAAGILAGDIIYSIDGQIVSEMELTEAVLLIRNSDEAGVDISLIREEETIELTVVAEQIEYPMVDSKMLEDGVGYLAIYDFTNTTYTQFHTQIEELKSQGMTRLIIDLRDNTGGLMTSVTAILNDILPKGVMVYTLDKHGNREDYMSDGKTPLEIPMVVLVNGYTASASEIFAGAVRDYEMAQLVGTNTFGKGVVQNALSLPDGSGIKLTSANYYTPAGTNIHGTGLAPDVEVELNTEPDEDGYIVDNQLEKAIEVIKGME